MYRKTPTGGKKNPQPELKSRSYRSDYIRKRMLQKAFKGDEKGFKTLPRLSETMHTGIEVLWRQKMLCDVDLITSERKHVLAHKMVLATCCDYFYDMFIEQAPSDSQSLYQVEVLEVQGRVLETVVESMYTGKLRIDVTNVDDLCMASHTLGMFILIEACEEFLLEHMNKDNCLQFLGTAFKYSLNRLTDEALALAAKFFTVISRRAAFRNLPIEHLIALLKRDDLNVANELDVFHRARSWIDEDRLSRVKHAADILATIRLPLLTPAEVVDNVEVCSYLMDVNDCQKLVKEALHYHVMPARQCLLQSPRTVPRQRSVVSLVIVGGSPRLTTDDVIDDIMTLNTGTNTWDFVTKLPEPRHHHAVATLNGFLYVAGGEQYNTAISPTNKVSRFDPRNHQWMTVASMNNCRQSFQMAVLNGALYAVGGRVSSEEPIASVEKYDPSHDKWEEVAPLSCPRRCVAIGALGGRLYAVGGSGQKAISSRVERYNPSENKWDILKPITVPRFFGYLLNVANSLFLLGGATIDQRGSIVCVETIERYCTVGNQWTSVTQMRTPRSEAGCVAIREKIYILGGYNWNAKERLTDVECYDTETNTWSVVANLNRPLTGIEASALTLFEPFYCKRDISNNNVVVYVESNSEDKESERKIKETDELGILFRKTVRHL